MTIGEHTQDHGEDTMMAATPRPDEPIGTFIRGRDAVAVRLEREYATGLHDAWSVLTDPDRVARWLDPVTVRGQGPGATAQVHFDDGDADFRVVECTPPRALEVQWLHATSASTVRAELTSVGPGRTRLVLEHSRLTERMAPGYATGWHWYLSALRTEVDGGAHASWDDAFGVLYERYSALVADDG